MITDWIKIWPRHLALMNLKPYVHDPLLWVGWREHSRDLTGVSILLSSKSPRTLLLHSHPLSPLAPTFPSPIVAFSPRNLVSSLVTGYPCWSPFTIFITGGWCWPQKRMRVFPFITTNMQVETKTWTVFIISDPWNREWDEKCNIRKVNGYLTPEKLLKLYFPSAFNRS